MDKIIKNILDIKIDMHHSLRNVSFKNEEIEKDYLNSIQTKRKLIEIKFSLIFCIIYVFMLINSFVSQPQMIDSIFQKFQIFFCIILFFLDLVSNIFLFRILKYGVQELKRDSIIFARCIFILLCFYINSLNNLIVLENYIIITRNIYFVSLFKNVVYLFICKICVISIFVLTLENLIYIVICNLMSNGKIIFFQTIIDILFEIILTVFVIVLKRNLGILLRKVFSQEFLMKNFLFYFEDILNNFNCLHFSYKNEKILYTNRITKEVIDNYKNNSNPNINSSENKELNNENVSSPLNNIYNINKNTEGNQFLDKVNNTIVNEYKINFNQQSTLDKNNSDKNLNQIRTKNKRLYKSRFAPRRNLSAFKVNSYADKSVAFPNKRKSSNKINKFGALMKNKNQTKFVHSQNKQKKFATSKFYYLQKNNKNPIDNKYINNTHTINEYKDLSKDDKEKEKQINSNLREVMKKIYKVKNLQQNSEENSAFLNDLFEYNNLFEIYEAAVIKQNINEDPKVIERIDETNQCHKQNEDNHSKAKGSLFSKKNYYNTNFNESSLAFFKNRDSEKINILNHNGNVDFQEIKQENENKNNFYKSKYDNLKQKTSYNNSENLKYVDAQYFIYLGEFYSDDKNIIISTYKKTLSNMRYYDIYLRKISKVTEFLIFDKTQHKIAEICEMENKIKHKIFAKVAHEFKTPLNSIISLISKIKNYLQIGGSAENIENESYTNKNSIKKMDSNKKSDLNSENNHTNLIPFYNQEVEKNLNNDLNIIIGLSNYTMFLISDINQYSSNEEVKDMNIIKEKVCLRKILNFNYEILKALLFCNNKKMRTVKPIIEYDANLKGCLIETDEFRLNQVILNLLSNAVKFTKAGRIAIKATLMTNTSIFSESKIYISIEDTGIGIKKDQKKLIFSESEQLNLNYKMNKMGSGLGLSICYNIAKKLGYNVEFDSIEKSGTVFKIEIPYLIDKNSNDNQINKTNIWNNQKKFGIIDKNPLEENNNKTQNNIYCIENYKNINEKNIKSTLIIKHIENELSNLNDVVNEESIYSFSKTMKEFDETSIKFKTNLYSEISRKQTPDKLSADYNLNDNSPNINLRRLNNFKKTFLIHKRNTISYNFLKKGHDLKFESENDSSSNETESDGSMHIYRKINNDNINNYPKTTINSNLPKDSVESNKIRKYKQYKVMNSKSLNAINERIGLECSYNSANKNSIDSRENDEVQKNNTFTKIDKRKNKKIIKNSNKSICDNKFSFEKSTLKKSTIDFPYANIPNDLRENFKSTIAYKNDFQNLDFDYNRFNLGDLNLNDINLDISQRRQNTSERSQNTNKFSYNINSINSNGDHHNTNSPRASDRSYFNLQFIKKRCNFLIMQTSNFSIKVK